jgi:hypothetical protein
MFPPREAIPQVILNFSDSFTGCIVFILLITLLL